LALEAVVEGESLLANHGHSKGHEKSSQICRTCANLKADFQYGQNRCVHGCGNNAHGTEAGNSVF